MCLLFIQLMRTRLAHFKHPVILGLILVVSQPLYLLIILAAATYPPRSQQGWHLCTCETRTARRFPSSAGSIHMSMQQKFVPWDLKRLTIRDLDMRTAEKLGNGSERLAKKLLAYQVKSKGYWATLKL